MTLDEFSRLAEAWGGEIDRWPQASQAAARKIAADAEAVAILRQHAALDELFATAPEVGADRAGRASLAVLQRLAAQPPAQPWYRRLWQPDSLLPVGSLACSALLGIWLAGSLPFHSQQDAAMVIGMVFDASAATPWGLQ